MTQTNDMVFAIYQRIGFRGAWEYLESCATESEATERCNEYNRAKRSEPSYPAYKVVKEARNAS